MQCMQLHARYNIMPWPCIHVCLSVCVCLCRCLSKVGVLLKRRLNTGSLWLAPFNLAGPQIVARSPIYTETILSNSTRELLWFEITKMLIAVKKINLLCYLLFVIYYNFWYTSVPYSSSKSVYRSEGIAIAESIHRCGSVSVCEHISGTARPIFTKFLIMLPLTSDLVVG